MLNNPRKFQVKIDPQNYKVLFGDFGDILSYYGRCGELVDLTKIAAVYKGSFDIAMELAGTDYSLPIQILTSGGTLGIALGKTLLYKIGDALVPFLSASEYIPNANILRPSTRKLCDTFIELAGDLLIHLHVDDNRKRPQSKMKKPDRKINGGRK